jgi:hypothetical protein
MLSVTGEEHVHRYGAVAGTWLASEGGLLAPGGGKWGAGDLSPVAALSGQAVHVRHIVEKPSLAEVSRIF